MRQVPDWNTYFMQIAETVAIRSKDPNTQVGAVIVNEHNHIIGTGYNGMVPGYQEDSKTWSKEFKYERVIHAEMNAILHAIVPVRGCSLYVTMFPCENCAKHIATAGIKEVYYKDDKYLNDLSLSLLQFGGVQVIKLETP
jgi:dCMP deaminase